jgi:hypothetical protein
MEEPRNLSLESQAEQVGSHRARTAASWLLPMSGRHTLLEDTSFDSQSWLQKNLGDREAGFPCLRYGANSNGVKT